MFVIFREMQEGLRDGGDSNIGSYFSTYVLFCQGGIFTGEIGGGGKQGNKRGKKGKDLGIDGKINFIEDAKGIPKSIIVQVKSGHVKAGDVRDLHGTVDRENAPIGVFITLEQPTGDMNREALSAGYYTSELWQKDYPKIQILTIEQLFHGEQIQMPRAHRIFQKG